MSQATPLAIAVVGCGHWGFNHFRVFNACPGVDVLWAVDDDAARRRHIAAKFPRVRVTGHLDEVLEDSRVTAVVVATPAASHAPIARAALLAGKHVLCEKPLATTAAACQALVELADRQHLVLMTGFVYLFNAGVIEMKRLLDAGAIGAPRYASAVRANAGPIRDDVNAAWDLASHEISIFNYLLDAQPSAVSAVGRSILGRDLEDVSFATLAYPGGFTVSVLSSWLHPMKIRQISLVGDRGMLAFDDLATQPVTLHAPPVDREEPFYDTFSEFRALSLADRRTRPAIMPTEPLEAQAEAFLRAIATGDPGRASGLLGWDVVRALEAVSASMRQNGGPVTLTPRADRVSA